MALDTNFNVNPYYDDFDEDKKFLRLLFKPGYAVQARELTQLQSLLQNQINRFGDFTFKNGSIVTGGQFFNQSATYINLSPIYVESSIDANTFVGKTILSTDESKRATVLKAYAADAGTNEPITLMVQQIYGNNFTSSETIKTNEVQPYFANTTGVGTGQIFSVNEGIYYYDGFFIQTDPQTVAVSKYSNTTANVRCGFEVTESIVTATSDTSLLDPAQDASNYQAPGADRYKIQLVLTTRALDSADDEQFIELQRIEQATVVESFEQTQLGVLGDILARRTYDESGNYTVKPFEVALQTNQSNTAQTDIILSPGKAYVYGFEFVQNAPTTITVPKPREFANTNNKRITVDYGYFLYTRNHYGTFPMNSLETVDIHCVSQTSINLTSTGALSNTKIGTMRVKNIVFDSAEDSSNSKTYEYKTYVFDVKVDQSVVGNVHTATANSIVLANVTAGKVLSTVDNAYQGAKLRITAGPGAGELSKTIISWNGATQTANIANGERFLTIPNTQSRFSIDFDLGQAEFIGNFSGTTLVAGADIDSRSKDESTTYDDTYIADSSFEPLIFRLGQDYIKPNTVSDMSFSYRKLYQSQTFSSSISPALSVGTGEDIAQATSVSTVSQNYLVSVVNAGTSPYAVGQIIPSDKITVNATTRQITVTNGNNMVANIVATIDATTPSYKSKTYVTGNTTIQTSGGIDVFGNAAVTLYATEGQVHIANTYTVKVPDTLQSLFASDVTEILKVYDFEGAAVSEANKSAATDITSKYFFDNGQRNSIYDHASIRLKPKVRPPQGPLVVIFNRFTSSGPGFFTVDSYTANNITNYEYGNIPLYSSPTLVGINQNYNLRDVLDFRPVRKDPTASSGNTVVFDVDPSTSGPKVPDVGSDIILDYSYYLPRIDKIILDKSQEFEIVQGVSQLNPPVPKDTSTGMTLYILRNPPYVANTADISVEYVNNKRYTMKDIGRLDDRVSSLEYYTSLSLLEQNAVNKQDFSIRDATTGLLRFKNGILVDNFDGSAVADVTNPDYDAAIDPVRKELRPSFNVDAYSLTFDAANSTNYMQNGPIVTSDGNHVVFIDQPKASRFINVNPFNVVNFIGKIVLNPASDFWVDTETKPDVLVNIGGNMDAWEQLARNAATTEWGSWNTRVTGVSQETVNFQNNAAGQNNLGIRAGGANDRGFAIATTTTTEESRSGVRSTVTFEQITRSIGERVVDVSIIQYMREVNILFVGTDFRPNTTLYPFFENTSVENNVGNRVNKFFLSTNNVGLRRTVANPESITIKRGATTIGTGIVAHISNNIVYVTNISPSANFGGSNVTITGDSTALTYSVTGYEHNGGQAVSATSTTITLRQDAADSTNYASYNGAPIFIAQGTGAGQVKTISSYNPATRVATISGSWTTTPDATSFYSIGRMRTDTSGSVVGIFTVPTGQFRIGEKLFRLVDNASGDIGSSRTNGEQTFFAQGLLQTKEEVLIQTVVPNGIQRENVSESRTGPATRTVGPGTVTWTDPLAETFLISPFQYPQGIFLSKIRLCFKSKDSTIPVTLQVRPVVNGYPSSSVVYPYSTVSLTPDKVKITDEPDLEDANKYTEFVFDAPLFLQPGEHSFVILANTNEYETYIAEIGKKDLVTQRQISEQPYGGSLFLSQNGSTWTADQSSDLMFRMFRYRFGNEPADLRFLIEAPTQEIDYDLAQLVVQDVVTQNTSLSYTFNSQALTADYVGFRSIVPGADYSMNDGGGARALFPSSANLTFQLAGLMSSTNPDISAFIDTTRVGIIAVHNKINNLELSNDDIVVVSGGSGYANAADVTVTISGGGGSGASAEANVVGGIIDDIYIVDAGSGYTTTPTITITPGSGGGSGANAIVIGETSKSGGPALARYITRRVTLAEGFDSGDLRIYMTAYKPLGSQIYVYAKYLSSSDPDTFDQKEWQLLTQLGNANFISGNENDYRELTFAPGSSDIADNTIAYTNSSGSVFNTFRTFAIKIVMAGSSTVDVPLIRDLRIIACPALRPIAAGG
jgi:hypothetical protein